MTRFVTPEGVKSVVGPAKEPEVRNLVPTAPRKGGDVIQLHERPGIATPAACRDEYASTAVSFVNLAPYIGGQIENPSSRCNMRSSSSTKCASTWALTRCSAQPTL